MSAPVRWAIVARYALGACEHWRLFRGWRVTFPGCLSHALCAAFPSCLSHTLRGRSRHFLPLFVLGPPSVVITHIWNRFTARKRA